MVVDGVDHWTNCTEKRTMRSRFPIIRGRCRRTGTCSCFGHFLRLYWWLKAVRAAGHGNGQRRRLERCRGDVWTCAKLSNGYVELFGPYRSEVRSQLPFIHISGRFKSSSLWCAASSSPFRSLGMWWWSTLSLVSVPFRSMSSTVALLSGCVFWHNSYLICSPLIISISFFLFLLILLTFFDPSNQLFRILS